MEFDSDPNLKSNLSQAQAYNDEKAHYALLKAGKAQARIDALEETVDSHRRRGLGVIVVLVLFVVFCGAGGWWLNSQVDAQRASLSKLPALSGAIDGLGVRVNAAETRLSQLPDNISSLINRIDGVEKKMNAGLQIARRQSKDAATEMATKLQSQLEQRFGVLDKRVAALQAERQADGEQLAKLNAELKTLRSDVQTQIASVRESTLSDVKPQLAELRAGIAHNGEGVATIANQLDRQRVDFEIPANKSLEVTPGLYLSIENANVEKQQIDGWLYVKDEHRTLWFRDQGLLKPITFYGSRDRSTKEVVITRVSKNATVGYVLLPKEVATSVAANQ